MLASSYPSLASRVSGMDGAGPRLLVAEDDEHLRAFLLSALAAAGFVAVGAEDGAEALRLYDTLGPFDVLLLDEEMPHASGRDVLRALRARGDDLPALLFSGSLSLSAAEQASLGVGPVVRKPCGLAALVEALCHTIAHAAASSPYRRSVAQGAA